MIEGLALAAITPFVVSWAGGLALKSLLESRGLTVPDVFKPKPRRVPCPGGPAWILGIASGLLILWGLGDPRALAVLLSGLIAMAVGLIDDFLTLPGYAKVLGSLLAAVPILALGTYVPKPVLPIVGETRLTIVYPLIVLVGVPIAANAMNMIDVVNGVVSSVGVVVGLVIMVFEAMINDAWGAGAGLIVFTSSLGFWLLHRFPSKVLPGDSGSLALGAVLASIAFAYRAEVVVIVALLPEALNGFFILSSIKGFIEHRQIKERPTIVKNGVIIASQDPKAPITLLRLLTAVRPLSEREAGRGILLLQLYSALLALATGLMVVYSW